MSITPAAIKGFFPPVRGWIRKLSVRLWRYLRTDIFTRARARVSECYEVYEVYEFITARGLVSVKRSFISDVYLAYLSLFFFLFFFLFHFINNVATIFIIHHDATIVSSLLLQINRLAIFFFIGITFKQLRGSVNDFPSRFESARVCMWWWWWIFFLLRPLSNNFTARRDILPPLDIVFHPDYF